MPDDRIQPDEPRPPRPTAPERVGPHDDFDDDRPRRRHRQYDDEQGDATGGLIPYKNGMALMSYYTGVFSLIPCLGIILGPVAVILGVLGFRYANAHPKASGKAHAIVGIVLGSLVILGHLVV